MKKRLTFQCAKCNRTFSFQTEITDKQELLFTCPYCGAELVLRLQPFQKRKHSVMRGERNPEAVSEAEWEYEFPEVLLSELRQE
jgi:NAD-dependent SIR2 family protein deacetylase